MRQHKKLSVTTGKLVSMIQSVVSPEAPAVVRLRQTSAALAAAEAAQAQAVLDLATEVEWDENAEFDMAGTHPVRIGADGTRLVDEHLPWKLPLRWGCRPRPRCG